MGVDHQREMHRLFSFLFQEYDFRLGETQTFESFGDSESEAESDDFRIRFVVDRGQPFVYITGTCGTQEWFDLGIVKSLVLGADLVQPWSVADLSAFVRADYEAIRRLFARDTIERTAARLRDLKMERARKMFPGAFAE